MNNELFIARSIDELPKETTELSLPCINNLGKVNQFLVFDIKNLDPEKWRRLSPITLEQLIAEHPEVVEKIFEAARAEKETRVERWSADGSAAIIFQTGEPKRKYPTATDYINSLKG